MDATNSEEFEYDVALSFAGEDRPQANALARLLRDRGLRVFYDNHERANLWGKDLYEHLSDVYANRARFCVIFLSEYYARKSWTTHERKHAQARAFRERQEYILPLRLDDTAIPGIPNTIGYVDMRNTAMEEVADLVLEKLRRVAPYSVDGPASGPPPAAEVPIPMPRSKPVYSDRDKDIFLRESFVFVKAYFERGLPGIERHSTGVEGAFEEVHSQKFVCRLYARGKIAATAKIWLGGLTGTNSICYYEGPLDFGQDNAMNDSLTVEAGPDGLRLRGVGGFLTSGPAAARMTKEAAAEYLWRRFVSRVEG